MPTQEIETPWRTPAEAAEYLGMTVEELRRLTRKRVVPGHQLGPRTTRYWQAELEEVKARPSWASGGTRMATTAPPG